MNLETKITIYKFTPQLFTLTQQQIYIWRVCKQKRLYSVRNQPFSLWTSLGLNQGPPDYESVALTN